MSKLRTLPYAGGKSAARPVGDWIAGLLPMDDYYVEPCAGMLGVLLRRPMSMIEIANDLDGHVVAWWTAVRDHAEDLARMLASTPLSRSEFGRAADLLASGERDPVVRGWAAAVLIWQSFRQGPSGAGGWRIGTKPAGHVLAARVAALSRRISGVFLESRPAEVVLEAWTGHSNAVIYLDPPYPTMTKGLYEYSVDAERILSAVSDAKARIAISGVPSDPWAALEAGGWERSTLERTSALANLAGVKRKPVIECLWTNYPLPSQQTLPLD